MSFAYGGDGGGQGGDFAFGGQQGAGNAFGWAASSMQSQPTDARQQQFAGAAGFGAPQQWNPGSGLDDNDYSNEPPLLEELGVNFGHIREKVTAVMMVHKPIEPTIMEDSDMAGPLVFCLALGFFLLLTGKLHFGYIYGFGMCGCVAMYMLLNLMSNSKTLDLSRTFSVFGYCLLPIVLLSAINVLFSLKAGIGAFLAFLAVCWCTLGATRIFETAMSMREQRYLIAYPAFLLYAVFALITIF